MLYPQTDTSGVVANSAKTKCNSLSHQKLAAWRNAALQQCRNVGLVRSNMVYSARINTMSEVPGIQLHEYFLGAAWTVPLNRWNALCIPSAQNRRGGAIDSI